MRTVKRYDVETQGGALVTHVCPPPQREWAPVTPDTTDLTGARVVLAQPLTWWVDLRAVCDPYPVGADWYVRIVDEAVWYESDRDPVTVPPDAQLVVQIREVWAE